jgi:hypothetical protein
MLRELFAAMRVFGITTRIQEVSDARQTIELILRIGALSAAQFIV